MYARSKSSLVLAAAFALSALSFIAGTTGCAVEEASDRGEALGRIEMPLVSLAEDGTIYRLDDISLEISGFGGTSVVTAAATDAASVAVEAPPGAVSVRLLEGWSMQRSLDGGESFAPVGAVLASLNPSRLIVHANSATSLAFTFLVRNASGAVNIDFAARKTTGQINAAMYPTQATGALAQYRFGQLPLSLFFAGSFYAAPQEGQPALSLISYTTAIEFYDDASGVMSEEVAPRLSGYTLRFDVVDQENGTQEIEGSFTHNFIPYEPMLTFGAASLYQPLPLDEQGYPTEGAMAASMPFTLELNDADGSMMSGQLNFQYAPNGS